MKKAKIFAGALILMITLTSSTYADGNGNCGGDDKNKNSKEREHNRNDDDDDDDDRGGCNNNNPSQKVFIYHKNKKGVYDLIQVPTSYLPYYAAIGDLWYPTGCPLSGPKNCTL